MTHRINAEAVDRLIDALLLNGYPVIEDVARILCVSPRTLQRVLNREGNSYSDRVERCRCSAACEALEQTSEAIKDISARLGYADASSFARAFRRWTGRAPRAWRKQSRLQQTTLPCQPRSCGSLPGHERDNASAGQLPASK